MLLSCWGSALAISATRSLADSLVFDELFGVFLGGKEVLLLLLLMLMLPLLIFGLSTIS